MNRDSLREEVLMVILVFKVGILRTPYIKWFPLVGSQRHGIFAAITDYKLYIYIYDK